MLYRAKEDFIPKPTGIFSITENTKFFEQINPHILDYLSLKWRNYHRCFTGVNDIDTLRKKAKKYSETWSRRFATSYNPKVYFATPVTALYDNGRLNDIIEIKDILREEFPKVYFNKILNRTQIEENNKIEDKNNEEQDITPSSLIQLPKTDLFVLFYFGSERASMSLVQLGQALSYCKKIIIFYAEGTVSESLRHIHKRGKMNIYFHKLNKDESTDTLNFKNQALTTLRAEIQGIFNHPSI